jgi:hypothetical protein
MAACAFAIGYSSAPFELALGERSLRSGSRDTLSAKQATGAANEKDDQTAKDFSPNWANSRIYSPWRVVLLVRDRNELCLCAYSKIA